MEKINFVNKPNTTTPINDKNLNKMQENIEVVVNNIKGKILWSNPYPSQGIVEEMQISLNSDDYDVLEVIYKEENTINFQRSMKCLKGGSFRLMGTFFPDESSKVYIRKREIQWINNTIYKIKKGYQVASNTEVLLDSAVCLIPIYIIGYKTELF